MDALRQRLQESHLFHGYGVTASTEPLVKAKRPAPDVVLNPVAKRDQDIRCLHAEDNLAGKQMQNRYGSDTALISAYGAVGHAKQFGQFQLRQPGLEAKCTKVIWKFRPFHIKLSA